jgi:serine/threonine protein kinase
MFGAGQTEQLPQQRLRQACAELERRLRAGESCSAEELFATFPDLASDADAALELIYTEFVMREQLGQKPVPADWYARFPQWRHDLEQLFQIHRAVGVGETLPPNATPVPADRAGDCMPADAGCCRRMGNYELLAEVGRGGMGVVYKARQIGLGRIVALKLIRAGDDCGPQELARFRIEATAAAQLQHPNIVQVYEVGEEDGRPYLSLEWVDGGSLEQRLAGAPQPARDAAALVERLARAVQHAHERGVIHRDLKPGNILLVSGEVVRGGVVRGELSETSPHPSPLTPHPSLLTTHQPKITDFGLARRWPIGETKHEMHDGPTQTGAILGTPGYMAPEQAGGRSREVGPAADIYALGAILYALLTGRPPFRGVSVLETLEQVRSQEPVAPTRLQPNVGRDLETICLKCLAKEPERRYSSAEALADDLQRFLTGEPIRARPTSTWERAAKWAKRRPAVAGLLSALVMITALGLVGVTLLWRQTAAALHAEQEERQRTQAALAGKTIALARQAWLSDDQAQARRLLEECPPEYRGPEWRYVRRVCNACVLDLPVQDQFTHIAWSPDGRYVTAAGRPATDPPVIGVWDSATGQQVHRLRGHAARVWGVAFTTDGRRLVSAADNRFRPGLQEVHVEVKTWDLLSGMEVQSFETTYPKVFESAVSPDGRLLALVTADKTELWDIATHRELRSFPALVTTRNNLRFNGDGRLLAAVARDKPLHVWDTTTGLEKGISPPDFGGGILDFSSDGQHLVGASPQFSPRGWLARVWDLTTGRELGTFPSQGDGSVVAALSPDGRLVATGGRARSVVLWELATRQEVLTFRGHTGMVTNLTFSPDSKRLASASWDGTLRIWDARPVEVEAD